MKKCKYFREIGYVFEGGSKPYKISPVCYGTKEKDPCPYHKNKNWEDCPSFNMDINEKENKEMEKTKEELRKEIEVCVLLRQSLDMASKILDLNNYGPGCKFKKSSELGRDLTDKERFLYDIDKEITKLWIKISDYGQDRMVDLNVIESAETAKKYSESDVSCVQEMIENDTASN